VDVGLGGGEGMEEKERDRGMWEWGEGGGEVEEKERERKEGRQLVSRSEARDGGMDGKKRRLRKDKQTKVRMKVARLSPLVDSLVN
jgi:hypothetical protein